MLSFICWDDVLWVSTDGLGTSKQPLKFSVHRSPAELDLSQFVGRLGGEVFSERDAQPLVQKRLSSIPWHGITCPLALVLGRVFVRLESRPHQLPIHA